MNPKNLIAIYDFEYFPYALGDVLTWNVRTAMKCEELEKELVDIYICIDEKHPASIYQRGLINSDNFELFFNELYAAFGTHPKLGNIYIFRQRADMLKQLTAMNKDPGNKEIFDDYLKITKNNLSESKTNKMFQKIEKKIRSNPYVTKLLKKFTPNNIKKIVYHCRSSEYVLNEYFIKYIYSHEKINQFFKRKGYIPYLKPALGCGPDVDEIIQKKFNNKKIVTFHIRLRRLDKGYGGDHSYLRDSDFLEWYHFLNEARIKYPNVEFVALGRLQEKPLEILRLPNVSSLRLYGLGLGHELTLMLKSDLFIGSSSGFAALANFSSLPYFITKMNPASCDAYAISQGITKLPFGLETQHLIYEQETAEILMKLLQEGLALNAVNLYDEEKTNKVIDLSGRFLAPAFNSARTTSRFYLDDMYRYEETGYLLDAYLQNAKQMIFEKNMEKASEIILRLKFNFPDFCEQSEVFLSLQEKLQC